MKNILLAGVATVAVVATAATAEAADYARGRPAVAPVAYAPAPSGTYFSIFGGAAFSTDVVGQYYGSSTMDLQMDTGFTIGATIGTRLTSNVRAEAELSYLRHNVSDDDFMYSGWCSNPNSCTADGSVSALFLLANVWWDFNMGGVTPYVGFGLGAVLTTPDLSLYEGNGSTGYIWDQTRIAPAAQLGVGVSWAMSPGMTLDLGYRLKAVMNTTFTAADSCNNACSAVGVQWYENVVQLGLRF